MPDKTTVAGELPVAGWIDLGVALKIKRARFGVASIYREKSYDDDVAVVLHSDATAALAQKDGEIAALRKALQDIVTNRDANAFERERHVESEFGPYWAPAATMVESHVIAAARAALGSQA